MADTFSQFDETQGLLSTGTSIEADGRVNINLRYRKGRFGLFRSKAKEPNLSELAEESPLFGNEPDLNSTVEPPAPPRLNIVIQIVGSRGDVQPFLALGLTLEKRYSHRVRIATHAVFQQLVEEHGLEFFDIGGNPEELMAFMVRNPGLLPSYNALKSGDVKRQREDMYEILKGCWRSCIEPDNGTEGKGLAAIPFVADAIIANPPSFAHIHCAEKLGIPLHLMFTMPCSPTEAFPNPLANVRSSDLGKGITNRFSYALIDRIIWHGLGDLVNKFRENTLGLAPLNLARAGGIITRLKIPYTYCWSPTLLPKPKDWGSNISVSGFYFLPTKSSLDFKPPADLVDFINAGESPVYIGFGSIVVDNPQALTNMVLEAIQKAGVRAIVSKGWSGLGNSNFQLPDNVYLLSNVPHSWLFEQVSVVVHHGGAGTTAAGLAAGKPTVIVPFFGDQLFWGEMIAKAGAGPQPVPYSRQCAEKLAAQIREALHPDVKIRARYIQTRLQQEQGCENGARHFHRMLNMENSKCMLAPDRLAVWEVKGRGIRLSPMAAAGLLERELLRIEELALYRQKEYQIEDRPTDPLTGGALAFLGSFGDIAYETYSLSRDIAKTISEPSSVPQTHPQPSTSTSTTSSTPAYQQDLSPNQASPDDDSCSESIDARPSKKVNVVTTTAKGVAKLSKAVFFSPMHFSMGIARGFQSIPIRYGDTTVRRPEKVTGVVKGIEVAGKELAYGFYDGITGVVTQPIRGAKENGLLGAVGGFGKGLGGLILKPGAGVFGIPAYALQGVSQEINNLFGVNYDDEKVVVSSRLAQGWKELRDVGVKEKTGILVAWDRVCKEERLLALQGGEG